MHLCWVSKKPTREICIPIQPRKLGIGKEWELGSELELSNILSYDYKMFIIGLCLCFGFFRFCSRVCILSGCAGTEWTGPKQRMLAGVITDYFFGFGYILLAGVAYLIPDWRKLQLAISAPGFLFLFYIWWVAQKRKAHLQEIYRRSQRHTVFTSPMIHRREEGELGIKTIFCFIWLFLWHLVIRHFCSLLCIHLS